MQGEGLPGRKADDGQSRDAFGQKPNRGTIRPWCKLVTANQRFVSEKMRNARLLEKSSSNQTLS